VGQNRPGLASSPYPKLGDAVLVLERPVHPLRKVPYGFQLVMDMLQTRDVVHLGQGPFESGRGYERAHVGM
jgi:hypothetical protein